jgi:hypothetical protein
MAKKRKRMTPEERAAWDAHSDETLAMLRERIDYYEAKIKAAEEEQAS